MTFIHLATSLYQAVPTFKMHGMKQVISFPAFFLTREYPALKYREGRSITEVISGLRD